MSSSCSMVTFLLAHHAQGTAQASRVSKKAKLASPKVQPSLDNFFRRKTAPSAPSAPPPQPDAVVPAATADAGAPLPKERDPAANDAADEARSGALRAACASDEEPRPSPADSKAQSRQKAQQHDAAEPRSSGAAKDVPYIRVAETFEKMIATKSRLTITHLLATLFESVLLDTMDSDGRSDSEALLATVYLCTNNIAPAHKGRLVVCAPLMRPLLFGASAVAPCISLSLSLSLSLPVCA